MKKANPVIFIIRLYQKLLSPYLPASCRYQPTCSEYFICAIVKFGTLRGCVLGIKRFLKCHPLGGWGYDPVPDRFSINPFKN